MRILLISAIALISCSKEQVVEEQPDQYISYTAGINTVQLTQDVKFSVQDYCGDQLYSLSAMNGKDLFMISIVTKGALKPGKYVGGLNLWATTYQMADDIEFNVISINNRLIASFTGKLFKGSINIRL